MIRTTPVAYPVGAQSREVTLVELWHIIRVRKYMVIAVIGIIAALGVVLAVVMPPLHRFTTVIEIGNQIVNDEIVPIETLNTVIAKLQDGYIPSIEIQFAEETPNRPRNYTFEVTGSEESQIVTVASQGPRVAAPSHLAFHGRIADALIQDHNRTADAIRDSAAVLLAEAEGKLAELEAEENAAAEQVEMFDAAVVSMERQSSDASRRITLVDEQLTALSGRTDLSNVTRAMFLSQQINELMVLQAQLNEKARLDLRIKRSNMQARLAVVAQERETARRSIQYRETTLKNIQATRVLGDGTIMSIHPAAPSKTVVIIVALIIGAVFGVGLALVVEFFATAQKAARIT